MLIRCAKPRRLLPSHRIQTGIARPNRPLDLGDDASRVLEPIVLDRLELFDDQPRDVVRLGHRPSSRKLPRIAEAVRALPVDNALIDGEAVVFRRDGHSDFVALRTKAGGELASFVAFDLLSLEGRDLRQQPLEKRREALEQLVAGVDSIQFSRGLAGDGATVFAHACKLGLEGIVSKRVLSRYRSGTSRNWLKCLNPEFQRR